MLSSEGPNIIAHPIVESHQRRDQFSAACADSPVKAQRKMTARMVATNFELYPLAKDRCEQLNPQVKRTRAAQDQFINSEIKSDTRAPQSAVPPVRYQSAKKPSSVKTKELLGQTVLEHNEASLKQRIEKSTRESRMKSLIGIHNSTGMTRAIHQPQDKDITSKLAEAKHTSFASYKRTMGSTVFAPKAPPVWKN